MKHNLLSLILLLSVLLWSPRSFGEDRTITPSITTQGDTSTASVVDVLVSEGSKTVGTTYMRVRVCDEDGFTDATNATIAPTTGCTTVTTHSSGKDLTIQSSAAEAASGILTISGVVIDTQTVTVGARVYEFDSHATSTITSGRVRVNIRSSTTASTVVLTMDTQPTAGDTTTLGVRTYSWVPVGTADQPGEISVGADLAAAKLAFVAAVNGTDSVNTANSLVSAAAFSGDTCTISALAGGVAGDSIVSTETFTAGTNVFAGGTLASGADCTAANAVTALVAAVEGDSSALVGAADGAGNTVDFTADTAGTAGNDLATTETMTNGSFAAATLTGGANTVNGRIRLALTNATAETVLLRFGPSDVTAAPTNWTPTLEVTHAAP